MKKFSQREARMFVEEQRKLGKNDQEVYVLLAPSYFNKRAAALLVLSTPTSETKQKYKLLNNLLIILLGIGFVSNAIFLTTAFLQEPHWFFGVIFLVLLVPLYLMHQISLYNAPVYKFLGFLSIAGILRFASVAVFTPVIFCTFIFIAILSFYLYKKMFPKYKPFRLKKDSFGEYILL